MISPSINQSAPCRKDRKKETKQKEVEKGKIKCRK